ncbi:MAG: GNAT family N-acetyltransferase [Motiliproteus sp.]
MTDVTHIKQLDPIDQQQWQQLFGDSPLTSHHFLNALEQSHSIDQQSGWQPQHLTLSSSTGELKAALPLYLKQHSYGEYVFDWSWADACQRAGIRYYPKLVTTIPFTPTTGKRIGYVDDQQLQPLLSGLVNQARQLHASSWHLLFADRPSRELIQRHWQELSGSLAETEGFETESFETEGLEAKNAQIQSNTLLPLLERHDCQFHWFNRNYRDFDHFLEGFSSRKRKNLRKERRRIDEQQIQMKRLTGKQLTEEVLDQFFQFYQHTYHQRGQTAYLNRNFFDRIRQQLNQQMLLVIAERDHQPVGAALFLFDQQALYGRWWGGLPELDCLHFEACYYQGIEFAIERKLQYFDPGTQGEHKLLRGFEPVRTGSLHWLRHPGLHQAVEHSLQSERQQISRYIEQARMHLPFKKTT